MVTSAQVTPQVFVEAMRPQTEKMLRQVMAAVNAAPDGAWINGSKMPVRDLGEYRRTVFEKALQMKTHAAEGAFSPGGPGHRQADEEQGGGGNGALGATAPPLDSTRGRPDGHDRLPSVGPMSIRHRLSGHRLLGPLGRDCESRPFTRTHLDVTLRPT